MLEDNLLRSFPTHLIGEARDDLEVLKREGVVIVHKTAHGVSVFLEPSLRRAIHEALAGLYPWLPR